MKDSIDKKLNGLEQTNRKILDVLESLDSRIASLQSNVETNMVTKAEFFEFKTETEEKFEFIIENAVTKFELAQVKTDLESKMATKADLLHLTDRMDEKFDHFKRDIIQAIRSTDKKFFKFAV